MPNETYIESFLKNNLQFLDTLKSNTPLPCVVYHSMPKSCVMNPLYRQEFMSLYPKAMHVFDTPETAEAEHSRIKAFNHSRTLKQICPFLIPVSENELEDFSQ